MNIKEMCFKTYLDIELSGTMCKILIPEVDWLQSNWGDAGQGTKYFIWAGKISWSWVKLEQDIVHITLLIS